MFGDEFDAKMVGELEDESFMKGSPIVIVVCSEGERTAETRSRNSSSRKSTRRKEKPGREEKGRKKKT